jgi:hypothetical protein
VLVCIPSNKDILEKELTYKIYFIFFNPWIKAKNIQQSSVIRSIFNKIGDQEELNLLHGNWGF